MASATDICNLALLHLKTGLRIGNISTDTTETGLACALVYPLVRDDFQSNHPWNWAKAIAAMVPIAQNPNNIWAYSYALPPDCLFFRRIQSFISLPGNLNTPIPSNALSQIGSLVSPDQDTQQSIIPFEIVNGQVFTNMANAICEYTQRNQNEATWPSSVVTAMSYQLAALLAPILTDGDPFQLIEKMERLAQIKTDIAAAQNANERVRLPSDSEFTRMR